MEQKISDIIRSQWTLRHSTADHVRRQARNLIRVHVELARVFANEHL